MKPRIAASLLLVKAAALAPEMGAQIRHLARILRMNQKTEEATRIVELPGVPKQVIRVRQDPETGDVTLIHSVTGEKRSCSCETLVERGIAGAWHG